NASTAPCRPSGPTDRSSPATPNDPLPLRPGSSTTTLNAATPHSEVTPRPADCHQPDGRVHRPGGQRLGTGGQCPVRRGSRDDAAPAVATAEAATAARHAGRVRHGGPVVSARLPARDAAR